MSVPDASGEALVTASVAAILFILGLAVGSFLNVCICRIPQHESVVSPGSHCPKCGRVLGAADNIPLLSFLWLRGRCRYCGARISAQYPLVELLAGAMFAASAFKFGLRPALAPATVFISLLIVISVIDLKTQRIPNVIVFPGMAAGTALFLAGTVLPGLSLFGGAWHGPVVGLVAGGGALLAIGEAGSAVSGRQAMGGGDIKLAAMMGLYLGPYVLLALLLGFVIGGVAGIVVIASGTKGGKDPLPFGPFLAIGAATTMFVGPALVRFYLGLLG